MVPTGKIRLGDIGDDGRAHPWTVKLPAGFEETCLCIEEGLCRVDEVALRAEQRGTVGADVALRCVVQRRRAEAHRAGDSELGDVLGDSDPVIRSGEAHPVQDAVRLGQEVLASVGGMVLGDRGDDRLGGVGKDRLA